MDPSSLIFVVIIAIWAAYLLGHWVRRRDQLATARSIDRFSDAMRVLERRAPVPAVRIAPSRAYVMAPVHPLSFEPPARTSVRVVACSPGARVRRTRVLLGLVAATSAGWLLFALGALAWWVAVVPTLGLVGLVVLLRTTALRQRRQHATGQRPVAAPVGRDSVRSVVGQVVAARDERLAKSSLRAAARVEPVAGPVVVVEPVVVEPVVVKPVVVETGWKPVPVPPPTYTLKPKATPSSARKRPRRRCPWSRRSRSWLSTSTRSSSAGSPRAPRAGPDGSRAGHLSSVDCW